MESGGRARDCGRRDLVIRLKRRRPGRPARREQRRALRGTELSSVTMTESPSDDEAASWPGAGTAAAFADAVDSGRLDLPFPGGGQTRERWAALAALAERDLSLARLAEGHTDALAIMSELGAPPPRAGSRWGVWAAQPPGPALAASVTGGQWRLDGTKQYCSGARSCTDALVTAAAPDGNRLFAVSTARPGPHPGNLARHRHGRQRYPRRPVR